jgi:hypothetical protein
MSNQYLISGATGATGSKTVKFLLEEGAKVRAYIHRQDERSAALSALGAELVTGDLLDFEAVRRAMEGVKGAYFVYPIKPGILQATAYSSALARNNPTLLAKSDQHHLEARAASWRAGAVLASGQDGGIPLVRNKGAGADGIAWDRISRLNASTFGPAAWTMKRAGRASATWMITSLIFARGQNLVPNRVLSVGHYKRAEVDHSCLAPKRTSHKPQRRQPFPRS